MMFHVGRQDLARAFHRQRQISSNDESCDSHLLLLLYAIECGLKQQLLHTRGVHSTERLEEDDMTHDLNELLQKIGSRERFPQQRANPGAQDVPVVVFHQVLRYGGRFDEASRTAIRKRAKEIAEWIAVELLQ
jgi:hypothetical protein